LPDPTHPTGRAVCAKGRAAPELVYNPDRLLYPMKRTRPKGDPDPGWVRIGWDEALQLTADAIKKTAAEHGPEAVAFTQSSPSTTSLSDSAAWIRRLMNAIGTPNTAGNIELCGWGRAYATSYSFGGPSVGVGPGVGAMCDIENAGCLILWGYNPSMTRLTHGTMAAQAVKRACA
jgi:anaerobic selenocysteine-containing dehydrogenase